MKIAIIHAALFTPTANGWGAPVVVEDEPGTGKSSVIREYARRCGFPVKILDASCGEGAYGVIPLPAQDKHGKWRIVYPAPDWTEEMTEDAGGIVFVDELTSNPPLIQAPQMALLLDKRIGSYQLSGRVRVIGACNPVEMAANGNDIPPPLANRCVWAKWGAPSVSEHVAYMLGRANDNLGEKIDAKAEEARVMSQWGSAYARAVGLETAFLSAQADWKNKMPKANDPSIGRAWASDRSWEMATRCLASSYIHGLSDADRDEFVCGSIGAKASEAWAVFIEQADMPDIGKVLDGELPFKHSNARLDRTAAVLNSAAALVTPQNADKRMARAAALWEILGQVGGSAQDIVVPVADALVKASLHTLKEAVGVLTKIYPTITAAKVVK